MIEIETTDNNTYTFILKSANGNTLLRSIAYNSKESMLLAIEKLHASNASFPIFERKTSHTGKFHICLKDENNTLIGKSEPYSSEAGMENGLKNIKNSILAIKL